MKWFKLQIKCKFSGKYFEKFKVKLLNLRTFSINCKSFKEDQKLRHFNKLYKWNILKAMKTSKIYFKYSIWIFIYLSNLFITLFHLKISNVICFFLLTKNIKLNTHSTYFPKETAHSEFMMADLLFSLFWYGESS